MILKWSLNPQKCAQLHTNSLQMKNKKDLTIPSVDKDKEHLEFSQAADGSINYFCHFGNCLAVFTKHECVHLCHDTAIPVLGIHQQKCGQTYPEHRYKSTLATLLLTPPSNRDQPKCTYGEVATHPSQPESVAIYTCYPGIIVNGAGIPLKTIKSLKCPNEFISGNGGVRTSKNCSSVKSVTLAKMVKINFFRVLTINQVLQQSQVLLLEKVIAESK